MEVGQEVVVLNAGRLIKVKIIDIGHDIINVEEDGMDGAVFVKKSMVVKSVSNEALKIIKECEKQSFYDF